MARDWQNLHTFQIIYPVYCASSLFFCVFCYIHKCNSAHCVTVVSRKILGNLGCFKDTCKVFGYSDVCYKPPSVPLCCSFPMFCLLTGCIDYNVRRLWEPRMAQSWAFLVREHSEWTIRPVLPKPAKSGNCLLTWGSWWISMTLHLWPPQVTLNLVMETQIADFLRMLK